MGYDAVDGCEIRWEDNTGYDAERIAAIDIWDDLKGDDDCVDIVPDTWNTVADLEWKDKYAPDVEWPGLYEPQINTDHIILNIYYMNQYTSCSRKAVAMHEQGHALGLWHSFGSNVMADSSNLDCKLGSHDIDDYEELWGES